jgi:hypothetical protein
MKKLAKNAYSILTYEWNYVPFIEDDHRPSEATEIKTRPNVRFLFLSIKSVLDIACPVWLFLFCQAT